MTNAAIVVVGALAFALCLIVVGGSLRELRRQAHGGHAHHPRATGGHE